jgi:hypothetical protein
MSNATSQQIQSATATTKPAHFTISVELDGFPVTVEAEGRAENLRALVDRLKAIGATPPVKGASAPTKPAGIPVCPVHNTPMKASRKPGSYFCPKQTDEGYCHEKA